MDERDFVDGAVIYSEGEPSRAVHFISRGEVEVTKRAGSEEVVLARLRRGQILGEMSMISDIPHSTTIRACGPTTVVSLDKDEFLAAIGGAQGMGLKVLRMLCERLADADRKLAHDDVVTPARRDAVSRITLLADDPAVERQIGSEGVVVDALPFSVGQWTQTGKHLGVSKGELMLQPSNSVHLSPSHFVIEEDADGALVVRDLKSHLGTCVNGRRIARFEESLVAPLGVGPNTVVAGGNSSPYRFVVLAE